MQNLSQLSEQDQMVSFRTACDKFMSEQVEPLNVLGLLRLLGRTKFDKERTGERITDWKYLNIFTRKNI